MECKPGYPGDFNILLQTKLKGWQLERLCEQSCSPPIFVYGHLMLPTALKYTIGLPQSTKVDMVHASLSGYKLWHSSEKGELGLPTIRPSPSKPAKVEGMLVFGLTQEQCGAVGEHEGAQIKHTKLEHVTVEVSLVDRVSGHEAKCEKSVDAGAFVWDYYSNGLRAMDSSFWPIDEFINGQFYRNIVRCQYSTQGEESMD
ncbi:hypothetical protein BDV18DRAFT_135492 [Aspergillus unguis]